LEKRGADPDRPGIGRASPSALPRAGFDYVHVAPPQYQGLWAKTLLALDAKPGWVNPDGVICVQIGPKEYTSQTLQHFQLIDERKYGNTLLCLYERLIES
jgi:16S rRNA G966 N2-methylase RsmD